MAISDLATGLKSLATKLKTSFNEKRSYVSLIELNYEPEFVDFSKEFIFQYYPEQIQVSKQINRSPKEIPGASLPLYQWVSSGARTISFTATFTCDIDFLAGGGVFAQAGLAGLDSVDTQGTALFNRAIAAGLGDRNVDIRDAVAYLERFMLPKYGTASSVGGQLARKPRRLLLNIPNSGIGRAGGDTLQGFGGVTPDSLICEMAQCEKVYESFFPSGLPRIVTVQLAFDQVAQFNKGVQFPHVTDEYDRKSSPGDAAFHYVVRRK